LAPLNEYDLTLEGTPEEQAKMMTAMRCIVAVMADPDVPFTHEAVALKLGLRVSTVAEALSSDECLDMLKESCVKRCSLALNRGVAMAEEIMLRGKTEETKLSALRSLTSLYRTLVQSLETHEGKAGERGILDLLDKLENPKPAIEAITEKISDSSERGPSDSGPAPENGDNEGRRPSA
jgi:hypothetical protein